MNRSLLTVDAAQLSVPGLKPINEDSAGFTVPSDVYLLENKGGCFVVADGVSSAEAGAEASKIAVERFLVEYYQTPDTWSVSHCGEKILSTVNLHLYRKSLEYITEGKGYLTTFSALIIKSKTAHYFHVGDSRIYVLQQASDEGRTLKTITRDHTAVINQDRSVLARAIGMDNCLNLDYGRLEVNEGDVFLLSSDGIHDFISESDIKRLLASEASAEVISSQLTSLALSQGSDDNISALVVKVATLPSESLDDYCAKLTRLPFPPRLDIGIKMDGYEVLQCLYSSSRSELYLVKDLQDGKQYAMKTPSASYSGDINYIDRFVQEEWIGSRIRSEHVVKVIRASRKKSCLYYLMEYVEGEPLELWIQKNQPPNPKQAIALIKQIADGLSAFHGDEALHRDLRPSNVIITPEARAVIVDFGSVYVAGLAELHRPTIHEGVIGSECYSDPIYLMGKHSGIPGDVYGLATLAYEVFCGQLPYGGGIKGCSSASDYDRLRYQESSQFNSVIPVWFDGALEKGVNLDVSQRYSSVPQFMGDLTRPNPCFLRADPVVEDHSGSLIFWKLLSGFWFVTFLLVIYLFSVSD